MHGGGRGQLERTSDPGFPGHGLEYRGRRGLGNADKGLLLVSCWTIADKLLSWKCGEVIVDGGLVGFRSWPIVEKIKKVVGSLEGSFIE